MPLFLNIIKDHEKVGNIFQVKPLDQVLPLELGYQILLRATHNGGMLYVVFIFTITKGAESTHLPSGSVPLFLKQTKHYII